MRRHARSWLIKFALVGIIVVFVLYFGWPGGDDAPRNYVAKVNGAVITDDYFNGIYQNKLAEFRRRFGGAIPPGFLEGLNIKKKLVTELVNRQLLLQEARRLGLVVTNEDLQAGIAGNPAFQRNGIFDNYTYEAFLREVSLTPTFYELLLREELLEDQLVRLLTDGVKIDFEQVRKLWAFQNDQLVLSVLLVKPEEKKEADVDPKALEGYFAENRKKYQFPAIVDLEYVVFSWRDIAKGLPVSDEEAQDYYANHPDEFTTKERVRARQILLKWPEEFDPTKPDEERVEGLKKKAAEILARVRGGEDFEKVAAAESQDEATKGKGGDLGFFSKGTVEPAIEAAVFKLEKGQVSEPIMTKLGFHIIRVEEKKPEEPIAFELVKDKIVDLLQGEMARAMVVNVSDAFFEKVWKTLDLRGPAQEEEFRFEVKTAQSLSKTSGIPDVGKGSKLMEEVFDLEPGQVARVKEGDNYVFVKLLNKKPERLPELAEVRQAVVRDFLSQLAVDSARRKALDIIATLKKNLEDWEKTAQQFGLSWERLMPVTRMAPFVPKLGKGRELSEMLTALSTSEPLFLTPLPLTEGGFAVVRLTGIEKADPAGHEAEIEDLAKKVESFRRGEFLDGWLRGLKAKADIEITERAE